MPRNRRFTNFSKRLTISLKDRQRRQLATIARNKELSIAYVVRDAVEAYLKVNLPKVVARHEGRTL